MNARPALLILFLVFAAGCAAVQPKPAAVQPVSTVHAPVTAEQIDRIEQTVTQIQQTQTTQITSFAKDETTAAVDRARIRSVEKFASTMIGILAAIVLIGLASPAILTGSARYVAVVVAVGLMVGSIALYALWPF